MRGGRSSEDLPYSGNISIGQYSHISTWLFDELSNHTGTFDDHISIQFWLVKKILTVANLFAVETMVHGCRE